MGHHDSVRHVTLMGKYHTCLQQNRQELERLSPVGAETPAPLIFSMSLLGNTKVVDVHWTNFHRCEP